MAGVTDGPLVPATVVPFENYRCSYFSSSWSSLTAICELQTADYGIPRKIRVKSFVSETHVASFVTWERGYLRCDAHGEIGRRG